MKLHIAVGDKFGDWTVVKQGSNFSVAAHTRIRYGRVWRVKAVTKKRTRQWTVQCVCGKKALKTSGVLMSGKTRRCRQCDGRAHLAPMAIGQRFGHLVIESQAPSRHVNDKHNGYRSIRWNCRCDCGRLADVAGFQLRSKSGTRQCFECGRIACGKANRLPDDVAARNNALAGIKNRAKVRGQVWELDDENFDRLIQAPCVYCGRSPRNEAKSYGGRVRILYSGIDRLDSHKGYTKENSVSCCGRCNRWKSDAAIEDFKDHVKRIYEHLENCNARDGEHTSSIKCSV